MGPQNPTDHLRKFTQAKVCVGLLRYCCFYYFYVLDLYFFLSNTYGNLVGFFGFVLLLERNRFSVKLIRKKKKALGVSLPIRAQHCYWEYKPVQPLGKSV